MIAPTVHLNGTSREELSTQYRNAITAIKEAERTLAAARPHGRDYYVQGPEALATARHDHETREARLRDIRAELYTLWREVQHPRDRPPLD